MQAKIKFKRIVQDSQDYASFEKDDEHMVSRIFFQLQIGEKTYDEEVAEIRQPFGTDYEATTVEMGPPQGQYDYKRQPWNHADFKDECEAYYRSQVGATGQGIRIGKGITNVRMRENTFVVEKLVTLGDRSPRFKGLVMCWTTQPISPAIGHRLNLWRCLNVMAGRPISSTLAEARQFRESNRLLAAE